MPAVSLGASRYRRLVILDSVGEIRWSSLLEYDARSVSGYACAFPVVARSVA
jgi:hypothetical protein